MRIIVNIHSNSVFKISGWRAMAVAINGKMETDVEDALRSVAFRNGTNMFDTVIENGRLKDDFILFINGIRMPDFIDLKTKIKDNVQFHLMDKHRN